MAKAIVDIIKTRGRPKADTTPIMVRVPHDMLEAIDNLRGDKVRISRPQVVRLTLRKWLVENGMLPKPKRK